MEMKSSQETDDYRYFDPKLIRATDSSSIPRNRQPFQDVNILLLESLHLYLNVLRINFSSFGVIYFLGCGVYDWRWKLHRISESPRLR